MDLLILLFSILTNRQLFWIVVGCLTCLAAASFLVLLHEPSNLNLVRLVRAWKRRK
jgi:hypothetical protein